MWHQSYCTACDTAILIVTLEEVHVRRGRTQELRITGGEFDYNLTGGFGSAFWGYQTVRLGG